MNDNQVRIYPLVDLLFLYTMILSFNIDHMQETHMLTFH